MNNEPFLKPEGKPMEQNYGDYKKWLSGVNATGQQPEFDTASDLRIKKYVVDTFGNDDTLRKMLMLSFVGNGIIDKNLADIYILTRLKSGF